MEFTTLRSVVSIGFFYLIYFTLLRRSSNASKNAFIAWSSVVFYALLYQPRVVILLLISGVVYLVSLAEAKRSLRFSHVAVAISICLGVLFFFKYFNFVAGFFGPPREKGLEFIMPVGISFYIFTAVGYLVDLFKAETQPIESFTEAVLIVGFWPHLAAGPILRSKNIMAYVRRKPELRDEDWLKAVVLILGGAAKKLLVADNLGVFVNANIAQGIGGMSAIDGWLTLIGFGGQIYADFSGYCDMAIGFAALLGFKLPANFNFPFRATSLSDFWRRWHISLSSWFKDYIFLPLGGSRHGAVRTYGNIAVVFITSGVWHGAGINFILWGSLHGAGLIGEKLLGRTYLVLPKAVRWLATFIFVTLTWAFFRLSTGPALQLLSRIANPHNYTWSLRNSNFYVIPLLPALAIVILDHAVGFYRVDEKGELVIRNSLPALGYVLSTFVLAIFMSGSSLPFIYFNF